MSINIDIDLTASDAIAKANLLAGSLQSVKQAVDDLDDNLDLDAQISASVGELNKLMSQLNKVDFKLSSIADDLTRAAQSFDDVEIDVNHLTPQSGTAGGNSPPSGNRESNTDIITGSRAHIRKAYSDGGADGAMDELKRQLAEITGHYSGSIKEFKTHPLDQWRTQHDFNKKTRLWPEKNLPYTFPKDLMDERTLFGVDSPFGMEGLRNEMKRSLYLSKGDRDSMADVSFNTGDHGSIFGLTPSERARQMAERFANGDPDRDEGGIFGHIRESMAKLRPTMGKYFNILAALLPMLISVGVEALGVATAFGAVAVAGAGLIGLGLIGHGENLADSMAKAKRETRDFKTELFETFQPTAQLFAPISARFLDYAPGQLDGLARSMEGLANYEDGVFQLFNVLTENGEDFFEMLTKNEDAASQLGARFTDLALEELVKFLGWLVQEADRNQEKLITMGLAFKDLAVFIYNVTKAMANVAASLSGVMALFAWLSGFLNNDIAVAVLTFTAITFGLSYAFTTLSISAVGAGQAIMAAFAGQSLKGILTSFSAIQTGIAALIAEYTALSGAAASAAAAMAMTGVGLAVVAGGAIAAGTLMRDQGNDGGYSPSSPTGYTETNYHDNRSFTFNNNGGSRLSNERIRDTVSEISNEEMATAPPSPGNN